MNARRPSCAIVWWSWWTSWCAGWNTASGCHSSQRATSSSRMSCRRSGNVRTSKSWTVRCDSGIPSSAVASRTSRASVSGAKPVGERARRDREGDVAHLAARLDEAGHRPAAAELPVVGVRREDERALEAREHGASLRGAHGLGHGRRGLGRSAHDGRRLLLRDARRRGRPGRAAPRSSDPRRTRRRRRCARRSRARTIPVARETREVKPRPRPAQGREEGGGDEPGEEREPDEALLGDDGDGVVCDATRLGSRPGMPSRRAYSREKPPTPTPCTGLSRAMRTPWPTRFARPEVIRLNSERDWPTSSSRICGTARITASVTAPSADERQRRLPAPRDGDRDDDSRCERDEARLGERDEEPEPRGADDGVEPCDPPAADAAEEDARERGEDRDREVAPVDRRVPEDGVDAEERRIRVEHLDARVPEDVAGEPLVPADGGERERRRDEPAPEPRQPAAAPGEPGEADREQAEREDERAEEDRAATHVDGPEERERRSRARTRRAATRRGRARARARHRGASAQASESASPPITP